jgi:hypothetical protein
LTYAQAVAANTATANQGVSEANERVSQTADVAAAIARDIAGVNAVAAQSQRDSARVEESARDLAALASAVLGYAEAEFQPSETSIALWRNHMYSGRVRLTYLY